MADEVKPPPGKVIVLEGGEGAGKTQAIRRLKDKIGEQIIPVREPGGTILGDEIRRLLLDPAMKMEPLAEFFLFWASRAQLIAEDVLPIIQSGKHVLYDRFSPSTYAYQIFGRGLDSDLFDTLEAKVCERMKPDCLIFLDVDPEIGMARARDRSVADRMEQEEMEFHLRVYEGYKHYFSTRPHYRIDANRSAEEVFEEVYAIVAKTCGLG